MQNQPSYNLQEYLSLGYLYLILLGIVGDVIFYKFLGINILHYASLSDVLISPITILVNDFRVFVLMLGFVVAAFFYISKNKNLAKTTDSSLDKTLWTAVILSSLLLVGFRFGAGLGVKNKIEKGEIEQSHNLKFSDDSSQRVKIIGQNSAYIFYVAEGQREISIVPIGGNIKEIKTLK